MDVHAVADQFRGHLVGLQDRAYQPWRAMVERRHAIEKMRRLTGARRDRRKRLFVARSRMPQRHAAAVRHQPFNEGKASVDLGRERDDADIGHSARRFRRGYRRP